MTKTTVFGIAFDAHDAAKVAQFWADTLGRQVADGADPPTPRFCRPSRCC
jgi:hypothetical protein